VTPFAIGELAAAAQGIDAIALGVSSAGIDWASTILPSIARPGLPLFMITKGLVLEGSTLRTLPDVVKARLPNDGAGISPAAIAGPCIAGELARRVATCVVLAGHDAASLETIRSLIETPYYHLFPTTDVVGAEVSAALKNAYAMGIAFAVGKNEKAGSAAAASRCTTSSRRSWRRPSSR
jgi:glycerol-3-phosphate dehydrogenase (NAD(P)+)